MLSQQEVADRARTSLFTIQRIERGEGNVRPKTGRAVAEALGVPIEELLPKAQAALWSDKPLEARRVEVKGPDPAVWGAPEDRPDPAVEGMPAPSDAQIHVEIEDYLGAGPARVTITRTAFLDLFRKVRQGEISPEQAMAEIEGMPAA